MALPTAVPTRAMRGHLVVVLLRRSVLYIICLATVHCHRYDRRIDPPGAQRRA
jgi:hypothetical protein